jgi:hypothetical protein
VGRLEPRTLHIHQQQARVRLRALSRSPDRRVTANSQYCLTLRRVSSTVPKALDIGFPKT